MSLLFEVMNAMTGTPDKPSTHNMPANCRLVLVVLANRANEERMAWLAIPSIAEGSGLGCSTVRKVLAELEEKGWLRFVQWRSHRNGKSTKQFEVNLSGKAWEADGQRARTPPQLRMLAGRRPPSGEHLLAQSLAAEHAESRRRAETPSPGGDNSPSDSPKDPPIAHVPAQARDDRPTFTPTPETAPLVLTSPDAAAKPKPAKGRRKPALPVPEDPTGLSPVERAAFEAIAADPSLQPITVGVCQLVKDLCKTCPSVDVAREARKAGMWMRADPSRRKKNGSAFLANWVERAQNDAAKLPQMARPMVREELPLSTPRVPPNPRDIAKPESILRARAERKAREAAGEVLEDPQVEAERVMAMVFEKLGPARVYS